MPRLGICVSILINPEFVSRLELRYCFIDEPNLLSSKIDSVLIMFKDLRMRRAITTECDIASVNFLVRKGYDNNDMDSGSVRKFPRVHR